MPSEDRAVEYSAFLKSGTFSVPPPPPRPRGARKRLALTCALVSLASCVALLGYRVTLSALGPGPVTTAPTGTIRSIPLAASTPLKAEAQQLSAAAAVVETVQVGAKMPIVSRAVVHPKASIKPKAHDAAADFDLMDAARMRDEVATYARAQAVPVRNGLARPWPLRASASLESVSVDGKLSIPALGQTLSRALPRFEACYEQAARRSNRNRFGIVQLGLRIGAGGHLSTSSVQTAELLGLDACLTAVTQTLVTKVSDADATNATARIRFAP
jgi:hypothetical protein